MSSHFSSVDPRNNLSYLNSNENQIVLSVGSRRDPTVEDKRYKLFTLWINELTNSSWQLTSVTSNQANWEPLGGGTLAISQITAGNGGIAIPVGGNVNLNGSVNELEVLATGDTLGVRFVTNVVYESGNFTIQSAASGSARFLRVINTSDTANASANIKVQVPSSTADGGAYYSSTSVAGSTWSWGLDSSTDEWVLADGEGVSSSQVITVGASSLNLSRGLSLTGSGTAGLISINGGTATDFIGAVTLVSGTATVLNTNIAATDRILVVRSTTGGTEGHLSYTISAGVSFTINSSSAGDFSTVVYVIFRQT